MKYFLKNLLIVFLIFLAISGVFSLIYGPSEPIEDVSLGQLVEQIKEEVVQKIVVKGDELEVELKDGTQENSNKEPGVSFPETLKNFGVDPDAIEIDIKKEDGFMFWLTIIFPIVLPLLIIGGFIWFMFRGAQRGQMQAFNFGRSKAKLVNPNQSKDKSSFKDVAGLKEAKEELKEIVEFLRTPKKFTALGAKIPKGALLIGPPGTGKTLLARAVATEAKVPFFSVSGSEFVEMFVGVGSARVRDLFLQAKKHSPAILFIDELDAIGRQRGAGLGGGNDEREQTLNQILVEMDGFEVNSGVIMIAATNRPDVLDPALLRAGRFDRRIVLNLPDIRDRKDILKIHARGKPLATNIDLQEIAERTPGFSGADLANLINESAILAARRNKDKIFQSELRESIEKVLLGPERKSHILSTKEKEIAAYHEAGHAVVAYFLKNVDPVQKISIIARGMAAGYTLQLPTEDRHIHSRAEFIDELGILLGGYAAEKIVFNKTTTGPSNDLKRAAELARDLVTKYGMSELGPIAYGGHEEMVFLGREIATNKNYSEEVAAKIDKEMATFINNALQTASDILTKKRDKLDQIAKELIKKEVIERKDFERLMKKKLA